ncbi:MAG: CpaF family protein [Alphaproteobacteria bacterium]|nr:CpaF family protein [Alphaproteobacteria bacterium]
MSRIFSQADETAEVIDTQPLRVLNDGAERLAPNVPVSRNTDLKVYLHEKLLGVLNLSVLDRVTREELGRELSPMIRKILTSEGVTLNTAEYTQLTEEVLDEVLGLGPLEPYLKDPTVTDILVNTHEHVFVERKGQLERTSARFKDERHLMRVIQKIVSGAGRRVDESQPWMDARLPDGSRVNALVPPCAVDGPLLSIRKFSKIPYTMNRLVEIGTINQQMAALFSLIVATRRNVLISGGTGSGKTTLLNALSSYVANKERIITIEDTAELQLQQTHVCRVETRPANLENAGEVTQRDLLKNSLRMRPDRIIVGEVRGAEVLDMLQAMNTGHDGSMTTVHANGPREALTRLEHMVGMTGIDIPQKSLRGQIASAIHVVIQIARHTDGKRRVTSIQEILGMEGDVVTMQEIYRFERTAVDTEGRIIGEHRSTGIRPRFMRLAEDYGMPIPQEIQKMVAG